MVKGFIDYDLFNDLLNELCNRCDMYWVDGYCAKNCRWAKYRYMSSIELAKEKVDFPSKLLYNIYRK